MNINILPILLPILLPVLLALPNMSWANQPISLHFGADYKHFGASPKAEFKHTFPRLHQGENLYAGLRFGNWTGWDWGIDLGWEKSSLKTRQVNLPANHLFFNKTAAAGDITKVDSRFQGFNTNLMLYKNLVPCQFDLIFTGGLSLQRPHANIYYTTPLNGLTEDYFVTADHKIISRFGFGAQWMFLPWAGIRSLVSFSNDSRFVYNGQQLAIGKFEAKPYGSSMSWYLGLVIEPKISPKA